METMNSQSAAQTPADQMLQRRRRRDPRELPISAEAKRLSAMYSEQMSRGEFDHADLDRAISAAG